MPLVRYEIRNEYSLANPDLYRAAAKDDPEGLLEGVAMAGLVGIVRQLGDLAEFAAEVFHDLHEEILATAARSHELMIRVQHLESEIPLIEKIMLTESKISHENFIYNQGVVWHAVIRNDQNHFTQGDLPHFIRNAYEECRGPPRLFMLDKFDVAGAGACLKRYTDPFFFKMEWASTELMKAEKEQQDKRARRIKKKRQTVDIASRTSENGALKQTENGLRMLRGSFTNHVVDKQIADGKSLESDYAALKTSEYFLTLPEDAALRISGDAAIETTNTATSRISGDSMETTDAANFRLSGAAMETTDAATSRISGAPMIAGTEETASERASVRMLKDAAVRVSEDTPIMDSEDIAGALEKSESMTLMLTENACLGASDDAAQRAAEIDDFASETENFVDALATMDSEVETDTEMKINNEDEEPNDFVALKHVYSNTLATTDSENVIVGGKASYNENKYEEPDTMISHSSQAFYIEKEAAGFSHGKSETDSTIENSGRSLHIPDMSERIAVQQTCELDAAGNKETTYVGHATVKEEQAKESLVTDDRFVSSFIEDNIHSYKNRSVTSNMSEKNDRIPRSRYQYKSESSEDIQTHELAGIGGNKNVEMESVSKFPVSAQSSLPFEASGTDDGENIVMENLSALPLFGSPLGDGSRDAIIGHHRSLSPARETQSTKEDFQNDSLASDLEKYDLQGSENELSDSSLKETSPCSSADSSIKPIKWSSKSHDSASDSDDEMDAMQVSSASSSTLSSPRPSTLATVFNVDLERSKLMLLSERSVDASPVSHLAHSPKSVTSTTSAASQRIVLPNLDSEVAADSLRTPRALPLRSLNSEQLKPTVADPYASHRDPSTSTLTASLVSHHGEVKLPHVEPSKSSSEPLISQENHCISSTSSLEFRDKDAGFVFDDPEKFPPPPPLPPIQWRMSRKSQRTTSKDNKSHSISVHGISLMIPDMKPKSFDHLMELPASQVSQSHETPVEVSEFADFTLMIKHSSQSAATEGLDNAKLSEPSITRVTETFHDTSLALPDGFSNVKNIISPQAIKPSSSTSSENISTRYNMDPDSAEQFPIGNRQEDALVMEKLDEIKPSEVSVGLSTQKNMIKSKELSELLGSSLDNIAHSQASSTSPQKGPKLPLRADELVQSFEQIPMKLNGHTSSVYGKGVSTEVRTTVSSCLNIQENSILSNIENHGDGSSISGILESRPLAEESIATYQDANDMVSLRSKDEKIPVTIVEGSQIVDANLHAPQAVVNEAVNVKLDPGGNSNPALPVYLRRNDSLIEAIASHDKNTLRKVPELSQPLGTASSNERGVLLEQIRNRSFSLRQIKVEKQADPRPVTNINVAAILEKANAIRQAFAGSDDDDEDDDWSDG